MATVSDEVAFAENAAWHIDVFQRVDNHFGFRADLYEEDIKKYLETLGGIRDGTLPADKMFARMWIKEEFSDDRRQVLPHFLIADDILVVSQQVADVLTQFDLGASTLHPVQLFRSDRVTAFPGNWYIFQIAERKAAFEPDQSKGFLEPMFPWNKFLGCINLDSEEIPQICLNQSALSGPDLWTDPRLAGLSLMVSDNLMNALKEADVLNSLQTLRCPVITA